MWIETEHFYVPQAPYNLAPAKCSNTTENAIIAWLNENGNKMARECGSRMMN